MTESDNPSQLPAQLELARAAHAAADARSFVERELSSRGILEPVLQKAKLVASELVTNAFKYGRGRIELRLCFPGDCLRLEVIDQGTERVPKIREQPADETGGWGLQIVDRLSRQWGVFEGTTHVWADLTLDS